MFIVNINQNKIIFVGSLFFYDQWLKEHFYIICTYIIYFALKDEDWLVHIYLKHKFTPIFSEAKQIDFTHNSYDDLWLRNMGIGQWEMNWSFHLFTYWTFCFEWGIVYEKKYSFASLLNVCLDRQILRRIFFNLAFN